MIRLTASTFYRELETKPKLLKFIAKAQQLSFGAECKKFERSFARWQGRRDAVFMNSGSSANFALLQALLNLGRLKRGDRIAFSAVTWSTNVTPILSLGLVPIPMDVSLETLNTPSQEVEKAIKASEVRAVFITNLLGLSNDLKKIRALCKKQRVLLLEDNCEALGSVEAGTKLGNFGLAATFSFYVGHHFSTIEGGMVVTSDTRLSEMLRMVRAHGWDRQLEKRQQVRLRKRNHIDDFYGAYAFYDIGHNLRPTEINGFLGNNTLPYATRIVRDREKLFKSFDKVLQKKRTLFTPVSHAHMNVFSAFALPILCKNQSVRKKLIQACRGKIEIRPLVGGNLAKQPFFKKYIKKKYKTPRADTIHALGLYMPLRPDLTMKEKKLISRTLANL